VAQQQQGAGPIADGGPKTALGPKPPVGMGDGSLGKMLVDFIFEVVEESLLGLRVGEADVVHDQGSLRIYGANLAGGAKKVLGNFKTL
jgi:hypothetical protein